LSRSRVNPNFVLAFPGHLALLLISTFQLWAFQPLAYLSVLLFRLVLFYSAIRATSAFFPDFGSASRLCAPSRVLRSGSTSLLIDRTEVIIRQSRPEATVFLDVFVHKERIQQDWDLN
jgi:hypothetical protein